MASQKEALALRRSGNAAPLVMWLSVPGEDVAPALRAGIDVSLASIQSLHELAARAREIKVVAQVHLKIDTGLSRNGATPQEWPALVATAAELERDGLLRVRAIWSHLGSAEYPDDPRSSAQLRTFRWALEEARAAGLRPEITHLADSAATLSLPETHFDVIRSGIALTAWSRWPGERRS